MRQALLTVLVFTGVLVMLPWAVKRFRQRRWGGAASARVNVLKLREVLPLGPQQRVMTVEVGPADARVCLVLGVTAQTMTTLHVLPAASGQVDSVVSTTGGVKRVLKKQG